MTDGITHVGVGMTMTRINADGDVEAIKDRKVEKRVDMLISGDLSAMIAKRDALLAEADALQKQKEEESKVFQERKHCDKWAYTVKSSQVRDLRDMAAAYSMEIKRMSEV